MNFKLVVTEKPSVAESISKVIGATERKDGYLEGNGYIVSWCFGHLIELAQPKAYDTKYEKWRKEDLPIFPEPFRYVITESTKKQFRVLKELMDRKNVISLIEATDAGREGELIFRLVYHQAKCQKPFERLWISSMEDKAIKEGFRNLRPSSEYDALYEAALCRERADWIVGINATRLFSTLYGQTLNIGRVMTPTLGMIVGREAEINAFRPEPFYNVEISVAGIPLTSERIKDRQEAERILSEVMNDGNAVIKSIKTTDRTERPPLLYDLTSLQRDANKYYGFTAQETLDEAQSLYEKKLITYPRTDSCYLTDDMGDSTIELALRLEEEFGIMEEELFHEDGILDSSKVSDHHAIIPTDNVYDEDFGELSVGEQKILSLVTARLLSSLGEPARITEYDLTVTCGGQTFNAKSKVTADPGWKEIEEYILGKKKQKDEEREEKEDEDDSGEEHADADANASGKKTLKEILSETPDILSEGRTIQIDGQKIREGMTTPKKRFTESSLLSAMERAGADKIPDEAERKGLGTPATRAGIIEKLVRIGFIERKGDKKTKYLVPTHKGIALITVIPEVIQSPEMTAEWEQKLLDVEKQKLEAKAFMKGIEEMISGLIDTYKVVEDTPALMKPGHEPIGKCPSCGSDVVEKSNGFFCSNRECRFALWRNNRFLESLSKKMTKEIAVSLLKDGKCKLKKCRSIKTGKTYDTTLVLAAKDDGQASFILDFDKKKR